MYRRYSENKGNGASLSQMKRNRLKDLLILLLAGILALGTVKVFRSVHARLSEERSTPA